MSKEGLSFIHDVNGALGKIHAYVSLIKRTIESDGLTENIIYNTINYLKQIEVNTKIIAKLTDDYYNLTK